MGKKPQPIKHWTCELVVPRDQPIAKALVGRALRPLYSLHNLKSSRQLNRDRATMVALDGATVSSVFRQLERIPKEATHLILSAGGNNALGMAGNTFTQEAEDVRSSLRLIAELLTEFTSEYRKLVCNLRELRLPLAVCTIYDSVPGLDSSEMAGLCLFNDTITRTAFQLGTTLIDLCTICNETSDYSAVSPIEPSASGGGTIACAIMNALSDGYNFRRVVVLPY